MRWYGFLSGSDGGTGGSGEVGVSGIPAAIADMGVNDEFMKRSVCTVRGLGGIGTRTPFAVFGSGGGLSSVGVGEIRPFTIEGRRPGWEKDLFRVGTRDVLEPGDEGATDDFVIGTDPTEVVDSAGDVERGVYGSDILVVLRAKIVPSLGVGFMI